MITDLPFCEYSSRVLKPLFDHAIKNVCESVNRQSAEILLCFSDGVCKFSNKILTRESWLLIELSVQPNSKNFSFHVLSENKNNKE